MVSEPLKRPTLCWEGSPCYGLVSRGYDDRLLLHFDGYQPRLFSTREAAREYAKEHLEALGIIKLNVLYVDAADPIN